MRALCTQDDAVVPITSADLPPFSDMCDLSDSAQVNALVIITNNLNSELAFINWAMEQFAASCMTFAETMYDDAVTLPANVATHTASLLAQNNLLADWYYVAANPGESTSDFRTRKFEDFN